MRADVTVHGRRLAAREVREAPRRVGHHLEPRAEPRHDALAVHQVEERAARHELGQNVQLLAALVERDAEQQDEVRVLRELRGVSAAPGASWAKRHARGS